MELILFNKGTTQVAIDPAAVAQIQPARDAGWTIITLHNRIEHSVAHDFGFVLGKVNAARATNR